MDKAWVAWWDNGFTYDDQRIYLVGVFTSKRRANTAGRKYKDVQAAKNKWYKNSNWNVKEITINKTLEFDE